MNTALTNTDSMVTSVDIVRIVRRMRGGAQSFLVEGSDELHYVAKFMGNPQGNRTLVNEWLMGGVLAELGIRTPALTRLRLTAPHDELYFSLGPHRQTIMPGIHLGSACPVNPTTTAIYDFLPVKLLPTTWNLDQFATVLVLDTLLSQTDHRQAVFVRERRGNGVGFQAYFIDHGMTFGGNAWDFDEPTRTGHYWNSKIYSLLDLATLCNSAIESISAFPLSRFVRLAESVPKEWLPLEESASLLDLLASIPQRQANLHDAVARKLQSLAVSQTC